MTIGSGDFSIGSDRWPGIAKLLEECNEVGQVCGKLIGSHGEVMHWDGTNLKVRLEEEIGDVLAAVAFVTKHCQLDVAAVVDRRDTKLDRFESWHRAPIALPNEHD